MNDNNELKIEDRQGYLWISFPDSIKRENILKIQNRIETEIEGKKVRAVIDLSNVKAADSIVINLIVSTRNKIKESKGTLSLVNLSNNCFTLFQTINLDKIVKIYKIENEIDL